jgi:chloramphenicol-sensitive protein RarD
MPDRLLDNPTCRTPFRREEFQLASVTHAKPVEGEFGLAAGLSAYLLWGFLPILFEMVSWVGPATVVADRTIWTLVLIGAVLMLGGRTAEVQAALKDRRTVITMAVAALLLGSNWLIYVYAVDTNNVLEASFGYFINPLMNVAIGMVLLGERQNRWQMVSIAIAVVAIAIQAVGLGGVPYIALSLAFSFAAYGYFRKVAGVGSVAGLFIETLVLVPLAVVYLGYTFMRDGGIGPHADPGTLAMLALTGPATAAPLLLFNYAVRRLRLTTMGMLQYIAPSIAFILAITLFGEHLNGVRLFSFGLIWLSLAVYTADSYVRHRIRQRAA